MWSMDGGAAYGRGVEARQSARIFNAIVAGGLETPADRGLLSELKGSIVVLLGWAAFLAFVFVPATQLVALCICAIALLFERDARGETADTVVGRQALQAA